jgi:hypothetical protein
MFIPEVGKHVIMCSIRTQSDNTTHKIDIDIKHQAV